MTVERERTKVMLLVLMGVTAAALTLGPLAQSAVAEETQTVAKKDGTVEKNAELDSSNPEVSSPQEVTIEEGKITILTKTFKPPGQWKFKKFDNDSTPENKKKYNPGSYVDIIFDPNCVFIAETKVEALADGEDAIQVKVTKLTFPDDAGQFPFYCEGNLKPPSGKGGYPPLKHWSVKVSRVKLYWETYDKHDNFDIDDHPEEPANGGKRIFPGKKTYDDELAPKRRYVLAVVEIPAGDTVPDKMYYRLWDVDDPSDDDGPIDEDTSGPDNGDADWHIANEEAKHITNVSMGSIMRFTSDDGTAGEEEGLGSGGSNMVKCTVRVGMRPGDNWRFAVAWGDGAEQRLKDMTQAQADAANPPDGVFISGMLTTWRKLHLELDSMQAGQDISPSGTITGVGFNQPQAGESTCIVSNANPAFPNDGGRYEGGKMVVTGGGTYDILDNWNEGDTGRVIVNGNASEAMNKTAKFTDDDEPLSPRAVDWSLVNAKYAPAYIMADVDPPQVQEIPFTATVPGTNEGLVSQFKPHKNRFTSPSYWATQIVSGFQTYGRLEDWVPPLSSVDGDPDAKFYHDQKKGDQSVTGGSTVKARPPQGQPATNFGHNISALWLEAIRDICEQRGLSKQDMEKIGVVHELGWVFGWPDYGPAGTPMHLKPPVGSKFNEEQIKWFREKKDVESESPVSD